MTFDLTDGCDDGDGVEETSSEGPGDGVFRLVAVPTLLLEGDDEALLELSQLVGGLSGPVVLAQDLHRPVVNVIKYFLLEF